MACRPGLPSCLFKKNYRRKNKLIKIINKVNKGCFGPKRLNQFLGTYGALWGSSSSSHHRHSFSVTSATKWLHVVRLKWKT